ncbi:MAG: hypothetical protein AABW46_01685 [Nanoarchaeota archaeon]
MNFLENLKTIKNSNIFKKWNKNNAYLTSCFFIEKQWQFDFYSKKTKTITSFIIENNKVKILEKDSKVFQKEVKDLEELSLDKIKVNLEQAIKILNKIKEEKSPSESIMKTILILQHDKVPLWNLSYITSAFNILNIKINAINSKIIEQNFSPIMSFKKH